MVGQSWRLNVTTSRHVKLCKSCSGNLALGSTLFFGHGGYGGLNAVRFYSVETCSLSIARCSIEMEATEIEK
jgi:hypothetical protein